MRAALVLVVALGCHGGAKPAAPAPTTGSATPPPTEPATPAAPKDLLPGAVEGVVQLYEAVAALPTDASCERTRTAIAALRDRHVDDIAQVKRARIERPAEVEALWRAQQARLVAAWDGLQRPACATAGAPDLLEEP